jgi:hypothetical protein
MNNIRINEVRANKVHWLVLFSITIAPFTLLRLSFFGFAELIILSLFLLSLLQPLSKSVLTNCIFTQFWFLFLLLSFLGFTYNVSILNHATGTIKGMVFDFFSYLFVMLACLFFERQIITERLNVRYLFKYSFYFSSFILTCLYVVSFFTSSLFGLQINYIDNFAPLVKNLHQISMVLAVLPFMGLFVFKFEKRYLQKFVILTFILLDIKMALSTGSSKAMLAILFGFFIYFFLVISTLQGKKFLPIYIFMSFLGLITVLLQIDFLRMAALYFNEIDGGGARFYIYFHGLEIGMSSPFIGLGTGQHIDKSGSDFFWDAHQTHLTLFLQSGLIGLFAYLFLMIKILKKIIFIPSLVAAFGAITIYSLGGDLLRRLPIWIMLILIYHVAVKMNGELKKVNA